MKYLSFAIPCYNSEAYMEHAIETILKGGEDVEIIIVNDGSKDRTSEIAHRYEKEYPSIVKAVDKENGGHGDAVNTGLKHATGLYFKVVDSDDWVDEASLYKILDTLRMLVEKNEMIDMLVSNYVYEKVGVKKKKVIQYKGVIPEEKVISWDDVGRFSIGQYILMHSVIYRTELLKECGLELPKHTFYVDNIYVYYPLTYVKKMYYINTNFYRYFIGRDDQSVNEKNMIKRIDQQIFVNKKLIDIYQMDAASSKKLKKYMYNYLAIIMTVSSVFAIRSKDPENLKKKKELWMYLKEKDPKTYRKMRRGFFGIGMNLPGRVGRGVASIGYDIAHKIFGFN